MTPEAKPSSPFCRRSGSMPRRKKAHAAPSVVPMNGIMRPRNVSVKKIAPFRKRKYRMVRQHKSHPVSVVSQRRTFEICGGGNLPVSCYVHEGKRVKRTEKYEKTHENHYRNSAFCRDFVLCRKGINIFAGYNTRIFFRCVRIIRSYQIYDRNIGDVFWKVV